MEVGAAVVLAVPAADVPVEVGTADEGGGLVVAMAVVSDEVVSDDVCVLLGRPATSLERFLDDHREVYVAGASRSHL